MAPKSPNPSPQPLTFQILDTLEGPFCNDELFVRLLYSWEARNFKRGNILMGVELLLLDSEGNAVQGFISANQLFGHEKSLQSGSIFKLKKFMVRPAKPLYRVSDGNHTLCFTDQTTLIEVPQGPSEIASQKFRLRDSNELAQIMDRDEQLYYVLGQLRLISGDNLKSPTATESPVDVPDNRSKDRVFLHLLMNDGESVRVNLWGNIAGTFRAKWNADVTTPTVLLITTVNPKNIGGALTLNSTSSTRLFFDTDIAETNDFLRRLGTGEVKVPTVSTASSAITKLETVTIKEINQFLQNDPQKASFYCVATVVDILGQYGWYYIACTTARCNTKLGKTATSLYCPTCKKTNNVGLIRYRFEVSVRDQDEDSATFVIFDNDGKNIAGNNASDVLKESVEEAVDAGADTVQRTIPPALQSIVGRTCKFQIKLTDYNFSCARQTFTVSRIIDAAADFPTDTTDKPSINCGPEPNPLQASNAPSVEANFGEQAAGGGSKTSVPSSSRLHEPPARSLSDAGKKEKRPRLAP